MNELAKRILESKVLSESRKDKIHESSLHEDEERDQSEKHYQEYLGKMKANPTYKKMEALCRQYGYELGEAIAPTNERGSQSIEVRIGGDRNTYHADIFFNHRRFGQVKNSFEIQTISVGSLELDEYSKFLKGCQDSYNLVAALKEIDLNTLYDPSVDYPEFF